MTTKTHITSSLVCSLPFITIQNIGLISMVVIGSVLPDIDMKLKIKHRGLTHSILGYSLLSYGLFSKSFEIGLFFSIGYISHLILDMLTVKGIKLFYPMNKSIGLKFARTDGLIDHTLRFLGLVVATIYIFTLF